MAVTLGTNIPAYNTITKLNNTVDLLSTTMERLSSGKKINRAGDDAAGLVISQNMETNIRCSKQAMNNIQHANAFLTVAENGMVSITDHFQRISDLLTNMANDTNDIDSRTASAREIIERLDEVNRLVSVINFNGQTILDGSVEKVIIQMGPDSDDLSTLDISSALTDCHISVLGVLLPAELNPDDAAYKPDNSNCKSYLGKIQDAIAQISTRRGLLGAYENRLESSYDCVATHIESLQAAKSYYVDADVAEEATNLTQRQILEQVNIAVLSNANSLQQMALSLLG